jgi:hypothetical protein
MHTRRRQFVRDGEVPVTVIHSDDQGGTNKLEAARQTLREQIAAREQAEQQLAEAQATIQALETQLAHERIAKEEALRRADIQRQEVVSQLNEERAARQRAEQERDKAIADGQEAEDRVRAFMAAQEAHVPPTGPWSARKPDGTEATNRSSDHRATVSDSSKDPAAPRKRRGRPPKAPAAGREFVEWWKPGWRERFR